MRRLRPRRGLELDDVPTASLYRHVVPIAGHCSVTIFADAWDESYRRFVPRVKQRTEGIRERGVATALTVLAEEGVAGLTARAVAQRAGASVPAIYEVFGDKAGLIREVFFEGFRLLGKQLAKVPPSPDPVEALLDVCESFRHFVLQNPVLAQTMFSRPFVDFSPSIEDNRAGLAVSKVFVQRTRAAVQAGRLVGDPTDVAHLFFAVVEGLAAAEGANRLGVRKQSVERRWNLALSTLIRGLSPVEPAAGSRRSSPRSRAVTRR
jgi:AcrR family transcriptional regulator